jgi:Ca-activated chloride channel family protein
MAQIPLADNTKASRKRPPKAARPQPLAEVKLSNTHLLNGRQTIWARIDVTAPKNPDQESRDPVDLVPVIDCSGSMGNGPGSPREHAFSAATYALERLGGKDRSGLILYADRVEVAKKLNSDHQSAVDKLKTARISGMTALAPGLYAGIELLSPKKGRGQVAFLLSDGHANVGDTDYEVIAAKVKKAADAGIKVSTFGLGASYDEDLLEALATAGGGGYYYLASPDDAPRAFAAELEGLLAITARDAVLTVTPASGVTVKRFLGLEAEQSPVRLGDLPGEATRTLLVELEVEGDAIDVALLTVTLSYTDLAGQAQEETHSKDVTFTANESQVSAGVEATVIAKVAEMEAAYIQVEAARLADRGDYLGARGMIGSMRQRLGGMMNASPQMAAMLNVKASELDQNFAWLASAETYSGEAAKTIKSSSYSTRTSRPSSAPQTPSPTQ